MRKCLAALSAVFILIFCFAGCDSNSNKAGFEPLVTLEQVNNYAKKIANEKNFLVAAIGDKINMKTLKLFEK